MSAAAAIWHSSVQPRDLEGICDWGMPGNLQISIDEIGADFLRGSMPVNQKTHQPYGLLHGGASCVLAETLGSIAGALVVDPDSWMVLGQEINANHLRGVRDGRVHGVATPEHLGRRSQVWSIRIHDDQQRPICVSRLTLAVVEKR